MLSSSWPGISVGIGLAYRCFKNGATLSWAFRSGSPSGGSNVTLPLVGDGGPIVSDHEDLGRLGVRLITQFSGDHGAGTSLAVAVGAFSVRFLLVAVQIAAQELTTAAVPAIHADFLSEGPPRADGKAHHIRSTSLIGWLDTERRAHVTTFSIVRVMQGLGACQR